MISEIISCLAWGSNDASSNPPMWSSMVTDLPLRCETGDESGPGRTRPIHKKDDALTGAGVLKDEIVFGVVVIISRARNLPLWRESKETDDASRRSAAHKLNLTRAGDGVLPEK